MRSEPALDTIADAILDGRPVDWSILDASDAPGDQLLVEQLRTLDTLRRRGGTSVVPDPSGTWGWGHLRVSERIGQGAYGNVYRAWDPRLDREVALKLLPPDVPSAAPANSMVIEEGRLLARVRHPNVVTIYGAERIDGRVGLWMEFVKGRTLEEALRGGRTFTAAEAARLGVDLCHAASAVHAAGLVHRDIKAQNVMLDEGGRLVLMDFGTGREFDELRETNGATDRHLAGTPLYLAPEVLSGAAATPRSDVYSVGVVLFRVLTNTYPVSGRDLADLRRAHATREGADVRVDRAEIPQRLSRVIARAIHPDPDRRYAGADALGAALAAAERAPARRRVIYATATTAAIVAAGALGWNLGLRELARPALAALGLATTPTIAVMPFKNVGSDPGQDDFVDGLTHEVILNLANIEGMAVRSQTSSFYFKDRQRDPRDVANQLSVDLIVEGTVQRVGNQLRITAQLVRVPGDVLVWSDRYDRTLDDVLAVQDEISRAIVNNLRLSLGRGQRRYQLSPAATDLYLRGRALVARSGTERARQAAGLFDQVIALAPAFAPAYAGLADAYAEMSWALDGVPPNEVLAGMRRAALKALDLDPLLSEAHAAMGITYARELLWDDSARSFERALALGRSRSQTYSRYAITTLLPLGETAKAEDLMAAALIADPLSLEVRRSLGIVQFVQGRYEDAVRTLQQVVDVDPTFRAGNMLARSLMFAGRPAEAIALWERKLEPGNWELWLIPAYLKEGRRADFDRIVAVRSKEAYRLARIHAAQGDKDGTFDALNRAIDDGFGHRVAFTLVCPELELLRDDPRLEPLRRRLNLR